MSHSNIAGPAPAPQVSTYDQLPAEYKPTQGHGPVPKLTYRSFAHKAENSSNEYENVGGSSVVRRQLWLSEVWMLVN